MLGALGLSHERWLGLRPELRRVIKASIWIGLFLVLVVTFGVWKTSTLLIAAVLLGLLAPRWGRVAIAGRPVGRWVAPLAVLAIAISYPYYVNHMPELPLFGPFPQVSTLVVMTIFTMMALGLNFVVGYAGLLDRPGFGNWLDQHLHLPGNFLTAGNLDSVFLWTGIGLVLITVFCSARLRDSRLGRAWIAIREDETAAAAMGVPLMRTKTWSYATGAFFGGVAGAYYASYKSGAFPDDFFFQISVFILCLVILVGMGNIWGVIFGACFLAYLDREGLANIGAQV